MLDLRSPQIFCSVEAIASLILLLTVPVAEIRCFQAESLCYKPFSRKNGSNLVTIDTESGIRGFLAPH
jgi:hypothetical protein